MIHWYATSDYYNMKKEKPKFRLQWIPYRQQWRITPNNSTAIDMWTPEVWKESLKYGK